MLSRQDTSRFLMSIRSAMQYAQQLLSDGPCCAKVVWLLTAARLKGIRGRDRCLRRVGRRVSRALGMGAVRRDAECGRNWRRSDRGGPTIRKPTRRWGTSVTEGTALNETRCARFRARCGTFVSWRFFRAGGGDWLELQSLSRSPSRGLWAKVRSSSSSLSKPGASIPSIKNDSHGASNQT